MLIPPVKPGYQTTTYHTRPQPGETCRNCGNNYGIEVNYQHVGGHGPTRVVECIDLGRCWTRKDEQEARKLRELVA